MNTINDWNGDYKMEYFTEPLKMEAVYQSCLESINGVSAHLKPLLFIYIFI